MRSREPLHLGQSLCVSIVLHISSRQNRLSQSLSSPIILEAESHIDKPMKMHIGMREHLLITIIQYDSKRGSGRPV